MSNPLPNETLLGIFRFLQIDGDLSFSVRLVSKHFNALVTPLVFSYFEFSTNENMEKKIERVVDSPAKRNLQIYMMVGLLFDFVDLSIDDKTALDVLQNIRDHTQVLGVSRAATGLGTLLSLLRFRKLHTVRILHGDSNVAFWYSFLPWVASINRTTKIQVSHLDVGINIMLSTYCKTSPTGFEIKQAALNGFNFRGDDAIGRLKFLTEHSELESLHMNPLGSMDDVDILRQRPMKSSLPVMSGHGAVRMPALKTLVLSNYHWKHPRLEVSRMWDWIRMTDLKLYGTCLLRFLRTTQIKDFVNLHAFESDGDLLGHEHGVEPTEALDLLCQLISTAKAIRRFQVYNLSFDEQEACLASLQKHAPTLFELGSGRRTITIPDPPSNFGFGLGLKSISALTHFKRLTDLCIVVQLEQVQLNELEQWCEIIGQNRNLRRPTFRTVQG